jgi:flagellar biosynthesis protein FlhB
MSEDYHDKTEEPTQKKLAEAREKGHVAKSQDLITSMHFIMALIVFFFFTGFMFRELSTMNISILNHLNFQYGEISFISAYLNTGLFKIFYLLLPLFISLLSVTILINVLQTGVICSFYSLKPKWSKLNIFNSRNYEHNFGIPAFVRLLFGVIRLQIVVILSLIITAQKAFYLFNLGKGNVWDLILFIKKESLLVALGIAIGYLMLSFIDFGYQKWLYNRKMRMSRREVKDEVKQMEGDVHVKNKIRLAMQDAAKINAIPPTTPADLLITNGSVCMIAIAYKPNKHPVPVCLYKALGKKATTLIELAKQQGIPILNNPLLANRIFNEIHSGHSITPDLYQEVAQALGSA